MIFTLNEEVITEECGRCKVVNIYTSKITSEIVIELYDEKSNQSFLYKEDEITVI